MLDKISKITIIMTIGGIILAVLLTSAFSIFEPQIKKILKIYPKIIWQVEYINDEELNLVFNKINISNQSDSSGDLVLTLRGSFKEEDFKINGAKTKPIIEKDQQNTYLKFDVIYPNEDIEIVSKTVMGICQIEVGSQIFFIERKCPFPFEEKCKDNVSKILSKLLFFSVAFGTLVGFLIYGAYDLVQSRGQIGKN